LPQFPQKLSLIQIVSASDIREAMDWEGAIQALSIEHRGARPQVQDLLLSKGAFFLFGSSVILAGYGAGMRIASIFSPNVTRP
jgi:ornithine cyclodeaminase